MNTVDVSRRALLMAGAGVAGAQESRPGLTTGQVVERIQKNVGVPWRGETVDLIVAGSAATAVRGIATTMMSTLDVLQRAAAAGKNLIITHEPTFYIHQDKTDSLPGDATLQFKLDFIRKHDIAVFRFHDHWHMRRPDGIATGMVQEVGWEKNADPANSRVFVFPGTPLARFAKDLQARLKVRTMRVVGDPNLIVNRVAANWGYASHTPAIPILARPEVDVLIVGETREWELVEYAQDAIAAGKKKALIILGHVVSEQAGMKYCASWLKSFITEVPIDFIPAPEPFWSPDHPVG